MENRLDHGFLILSWGESGFAMGRCQICDGPSPLRWVSGGEWGDRRLGSAVSREDIMRQLELLRVEHRDLDSAIAALIHGGSMDQMQVARLKKRKLRLRDEIATLEDALVPDIIA